MSFRKFDLSEEIYLGLQDVRYEEPTPIQEQSIPLILEGKDVIGAAQTGTGKTGAFVIPLMDMILKNKSEHTQALILTPTRELAQQIDEQIFALGYHTGITSATVIGGSDFGAQVKSIRAGVDIIVATPGRFIDQMNVLNVDFSHLNYLVLDEADRMLDMGFLPDVTKIVDSLPKERQTLLFSATMPNAIKKIVARVMKDPETIEFDIEKPVDSVDQQVYFVPGNQRLKLIEELFDELDWSTAIIFTATKKGTDQLERLLTKRGVSAVSMHGDRSQDERNEALRAFKNKTYPVMVATDVLSRGIDIENVSLIINYDVPNSPDDYIHRIGRTGRYDKTGTAITFVTSSGRKYFDAIEKVVGDQLHIKELPDSMNKNKKKKPDNKEKPQSSQKDSQSTKVDRDSLPPRPARLTNPNIKKTDDDKESDESPKDNKQTEGSSKQDKKQGAQQQEENTRQKEQPNRDKQSTAPKAEERASFDKDFQPEVIEKAVSRNKWARKPAKGVWGIVKSMIPRFRR